MMAYFDESMETGRLPMTAVSGYLFEPEAYSAFNDDMLALLQANGLSYFRMAEALHLRGQFERFRDTPQKAVEIESAVIRIVRKYAVLGVAGGVSEAHLSLLQPAGMEHFWRSAYSFLTQWCLSEVGRWADRSNFNGQITYFFEAGCNSEAEANSAMSSIVRRPHFQRPYRYGSHHFVAKQEMVGLQAADMLAWFTRRECEDLRERRLGQTPRTRRKDFQALIGETDSDGQQIEHRFKYFDEESLMVHFSQPENSHPSMRWYKS